MSSKRNPVYNLRFFLDLLLLNSAYLLSAAAAQSLEILLERSYMFLLFIAGNLLWIITAGFSGQYDDLKIKSIPTRILNILKNTSYQFVLIVMFVFFVKENLFTRNFITYFTVGFAVVSVIKEILIAGVSVNAERKRKCLIIGENDLAQRFADFLKENRAFGFDLHGIFPVGGIESPGILDNTISENGITDVVISLPPEQYGSVDKILRICDVFAVKSFILPDYFNLLSNKFRLDLFGDFPVIKVRSNPLDEIQWRFLKRAADISGALLLMLFVFWWLFPIIALIIKMDSKGPVLFVQPRVGYGNKLFNCYKFRTMTVQAGRESDKMNPAYEGDSRITKSGALLRKFNFDELPQIFNILKGEMSFIGPRPHAVPYNNSYGEIVEEIKLRHRVLPGITGWAQIHGYRGDSLDEEENKIRTYKRIQYDIWYIENWSFALDFRILLTTILQIFLIKNTGQ